MVVLRRVKVGTRIVLLTPVETAEILRISKSTMYRWIAGNRVPFIRLPGGDVRIIEEELHDWMAKRHLRAL
jgi:excisionase family DNA binding protein